MRNIIGKLIIQRNWVITSGLTTGLWPKGRLWPTLASLWQSQPKFSSGGEFRTALECRHALGDHQQLTGLTRVWPESHPNWVVSKRMCWQTVWESQAAGWASLRSRDCLFFIYYSAVHVFTHMGKYEHRRSLLYGLIISTTSNTRKLTRRLT